jgi:hypothetical protein
MFTRVVVALALVSVVGCGSAATHSGTAAKAASCTNRLLMAAKPIASRAPKAAARRYVMMTYCQPFARKGWVYDDGSLSIKAQLWLVQGTRKSCDKTAPGGQNKTVPCAALATPDEPRMVDCTLLRFVRRNEVRTYLARLEAGRRVRCEDGTPLANLGVDSS